MAEVHLSLSLDLRNGGEPSLPGRTVHKYLAGNRWLKPHTEQWDEKQNSQWQSLCISFAWCPTALANMRQYLWLWGECHRSSHSTVPWSHSQQHDFFFVVVFQNLKLLASVQHCICTGIIGLGDTCMAKLKTNSHSILWMCFGVTSNWFCHVCAYLGLLGVPISFITFLLYQKIFY